MSSIIKPQTIFFDTNHLINMSKLRRRLSLPEEESYQRLIELMREGFVIPTIALRQPSEWPLKRNRNGALEIADVIDIGLGCKEVATLQIALVIEVLEEIKRIHERESWNLPPIMYDALRDPPWLTFLIENTQLGRDEWRKRGLIGTTSHERTMTEKLRSWPTPHENARGEFKALVNAAFVRSQNPRSTEQLDPMRAALLRVERSPMITEFLTAEFAGQDIKALIASIDPSRCPTLRHWSRFWKLYAKGKSTTGASDDMDVVFFPAHVYCDFSLTERQMTHFLRATDDSFKNRVFASPRELLRTIDPIFAGVPSHS